MRPTSSETADKRMAAIDIDLRSKVPEILRLGLDRMKEMMLDNKASHSNINRGVETMHKLLKELKEEDMSNGAEIPKDTQELTRAPIISLTAVK